MASTSLSLHWERMKRLDICSFGIKNKILQRSSFQAINKKERRMFQLLTKINTLKLQIFFMQKANMKMHFSFISSGRLHLDQMKCSHWDLKILKTKMDKNLFLYYANKKNQRKKFTISEELYTQVMNFKEMKVNNGTYQIRSFITPTGKTITSHFVFDLTRSKLQKKFSRKFAKLIPDIKIKTKRHQNVIYFKWV